MKRGIAILGSTGSIGKQAIEVIGLHPDRFFVTALTAHKNAALLFEQVRALRPRLAALTGVSEPVEIPDDLGFCEFRFGQRALEDVAREAEGQDVLAAVVGMVGLKSVMTARQAGKRVLLANKETLVAGGEMVMNACPQGTLLPVDSEHSAIFQCLQGAGPNPYEKILLTASGGPFRTWEKERIRTATVEQALGHPTWSMGAKITIDSASMMNKGLEIIEAARLFEVDGDDIDVVVHRESIIHSLIEYTDNSVIAQLGVPDMRIPIQYAITYPERYPSPVAELSLAQIGKLTFFEPDYETFACLTACKRALRMGGVATAIANGANEEANMLFRQGKIRFLEIGELVTGAVDSVPNMTPTKVEDILLADRLARQYVRDRV